MSAVAIPVHGHRAAGDSMAQAYISRDSLSLFTTGIIHSQVQVAHYFSSSHSFHESSDERISFISDESGYNAATMIFEHLKMCLKLSRKYIKRPYLTGETILLALFCLLTQKDPTDQSSSHLICGYLGALNHFVTNARGHSFEERLFETGVTELPNQNLEDALWGSREQLAIPTEELQMDANVVPFLDQSIYAFSNGQCFFITQNKYIGIGPRAMRPDDKIFIPFGCDVPLVIRSTGKESVIIGSCLIHGLMKGEIMEKLARGNVESEELEFL